MKYAVCLIFLILFVPLAFFDISANGENETVTCAEDYKVVLKPWLPRNHQPN